MFQHERHFTREEAQALLPRVNDLMTRAQALAEQVGRRESQSIPVSPAGRKNGKVHGHPDAKQPSPADELAKVLGELNELGIVVRDLSSGLIDFPAFREGREIYLCWRLGEPLELEWWHDLTTGFGGRQPLD